MSKSTSHELLKLHFWPAYCHHESNIWDTKRRHEQLAVVNQELLTVLAKLNHYEVYKQSQEYGGHVSLTFFRQHQLHRNYLPYLNLLYSITFQKSDHFLFKYSAIFTTQYLKFLLSLDCAIYNLDLSNYYTSPHPNSNQPVLHQNQHRHSRHSRARFRSISINLFVYFPHAKQLMSLSSCQLNQELLGVS
jgi:hypothetical protein